jgi:hypothetical protein
MNQVLNFSNIMEERFVAFIDILGFKGIVKSIELNNNENNPDLKRIKSILNFMNEETFDPNYSADLPVYVEKDGGLIELELGDPKLTYVSDCLIISSEPTLDGFKALSRKIHKITSDLAFDGVFCRGAITKGKLFHHDKVIFGSSYVKAYKLEEEKADFPRVIIDPDIIDFFDITNEKMPLSAMFYGKDIDGFYYQRYWTWQLFPPYIGRFEDYLMVVRKHIIDNLVAFEKDERLMGKYTWLKKEFNSLVDGWNKFNKFNVNRIESLIQ